MDLRLAVQLVADEEATIFLDGVGYNSHGSGKAVFSHETFDDWIANYDFDSEEDAIDFFRQDWVTEFINYIGLG